MTSRTTSIGLALVLAACATASAFAQDHGDHGDHGGPGGGRGGPPAGNAERGPGGPGPGGRGPEGPRPGGPGPGVRPGGPGPNWHGGGPDYRGRGNFVFDQRYHHNHYYPSRGFVGPLPYGSVSIGFGGGSYFFHSGVWYRPYRGNYIVVDAPIGIYVPTLPPDYAPLWISGTSYYYADGAYYVAAPGQGYQVVAPPPGADVAQPAPQVVSPPAPDPIYYPRSGQDAGQTEADRRDCNAWATTQPQAMADAGVFKRAVDACMDGRGYTVR